MKVVALMSGGPDSATLAAFLKAKGREILPMNVYYGQRNRREMEAFEEIRKVLGLPEARVVCLDNIFSLLKSQGGMLLSQESTEKLLSQKDIVTVVPYRNLVFSAVAAIYAVEQGACAVALATHFTDCSEVYGPYPDCSVIFSESMDVVLSLGHVPGIRYSTPFSHMTKAQILKLGYELGVPLEKTWSCYNNEEKHCGACRSCLTRKAAFVEAGIPDLTPYLK